MTPKPDTTKDKPRKRGAPIGNRNAMTNGSRISRLSLGELPKEMSRVTRYCRDYRRALEAVISTQSDGEVNLTQAHLIDAACTHEQHAQVCRWLMRRRISKMSTADIRECSKQIAQAKDARNKAVERLGLDRDKAGDAIEALYSIIPVDDDYESPDEDKEELSDESD